MKIRSYLYIMTLIVTPQLCQSANCPVGDTTCNKRAIFSRDIGEADASIQQKEANNIFVPNHHDFGVYETDNTSEGASVGLIADSMYDAAVGAASYIFHLLDDSIGWVDGQVKSADGTRGGVSQSDEITESEYESWITELPTLIGSMDYHLVIFNCQHFASDLY